MSDNVTRPPDRQRPVLDPSAFRHRLDEEVERVRRSGGFLSLALFQAHSGSTEVAAPPASLARVAERLRATVRLQDVLAERGSRLVLLMPDTTAGEGLRAAERLLAIVNAPDDPAQDAAPMLRASVGVATTYGEVEGGGTALLAAAEEAVREALPGRFTGSRTMNGRPRILVVDDDTTFAHTLADAISEQEWEAHPCTDTADARERVKGGAYSGFFIDVVMPGASGVEILAEVMATEPRRPVVLMSGLDVDHAMILDAMSHGPVLFARKPFSTADLSSSLQMIRDLIPGRRGRGPRRT
jgi:PleD family two-component response regulator